MAGKEFGSLTKEPPLSTHDATLRAVSPGMSYSNLLDYARNHAPATHRDAPGLVSKRYLFIDRDNIIRYDHFLSLTKTHRLETPFIRKIMYFVWAYRDERIRRFVCERIADKNGRWRISQLLNKANSNFFEQWMQSTTARKARSNFEYFLVEAGIYDPKSRSVHLELDDGWLARAAVVAAQHESNALDREELLTDPIAFLTKKGWLGLINSPDNPPTISPILATDSGPLEDYAIRTKPLASPTASDWNRRSPAASGKASTTATIDLVTRERANRSHFMLEKLLANIAKGKGLSPKNNQSIDLFFETPEGAVITEIKSCTDNNFHSQVRKGVSQLFEYSFLNASLFRSKVTMVLLMETAPPTEKDWIVDYLTFLGIVLAWKDPKGARLLTKSNLPRSLAGIISKI